MTLAQCPPDPLRLDGELDASLSRWLWLVKWLLVIPHVIVLAFLWLAFFVLWLVALVAIVFTGRCPRAISDFNVGVLRWTGVSASTPTARWAPTTTRPSCSPTCWTTPPRLHVEYPQTLSRGLVLVKWWLLALPHYLIVAVFVGGAWAGWNTANDQVSWSSSVA